MGDFHSINRENRKKQLRRQVVQGEPAGQMSGDREEEARAALKMARKRKRKIRLILLAVFILCVFGFFQYQKYYQFTGYDVKWETQIGSSTMTGYENFGTNVLKYTKDGVSYIDDKGKTVWVQSYEMKNPVAAVQGGFAAVADLQGNQIYICDTGGCTGVATTVLPITKVTVAGNGVTAALLEDSKSSYITYYKKDGSVLDISITDRISGTGYPLDISLSPDGNQLMASYVYVEQGSLKSRVIFYDFSEIGKSIPTRIVGGFDDIFADSMVPRVRYLSEIYSCAFSDDGITFFSSENLRSPKVVAQIALEEEIQTVMYSDQYVGVIVRSAAGENPYRMDIYKINGEKMFSREFDYQYRYGDIDGERVILYNEDSCKVYNMSGVEKLSTDFDMQVSKITLGRFPNTLIVTGTNVMKEIKLQ